MRPPFFQKLTECEMKAMVEAPNHRRIAVIRLARRIEMEHLLHNAIFRSAASRKQLSRDFKLDTIANAMPTIKITDDLGVSLDVDLAQGASFLEYVQDLPRFSCMAQVLRACKAPRCATRWSSPWRPLLLFRIR